MITVYVRNIFAMIRLRSFSTSINENKICTKNLIKYLTKLTQILPQSKKNEHLLCD